MGSFRPNGFGLHDMAGNVSEWLEDCWHDHYYGAPRAGSARTRGGACDERHTPRVVRGGAWRFTSGFRSASRGRWQDHIKGDEIGFRVASVPE